MKRPLLQKRYHGQDKMFKGVLLTPLKKVENPLGDVFHGMKYSDNGFVGFQEAYFSTLRTGAIKPWKKHLNMTLNLIVPIGAVKIVLFDERENSVSKGQFMETILSIDNYYRLTIPPEIWIAMKGEGESMNLLLNIANLEHDPLEIIRTELNSISYKW